MISAGLISLGSYIPGKPVPPNSREQLVALLRHDTLLYPEYIDAIAHHGHLPGTIETNDDGWGRQPWFQSWLEKLPPKKRAAPFQGTRERRRVPLDPVSVRQSMVPHPMLSSDAETLAGALALYNSGVMKDEIDLVLVSSLVPDRHVPLHASLVQHKLGLKNAGAYNVDTCCSSFITMLEMACGLIQSGIKKQVLIVASSMDSHINDKSTYWSVNTGDAAAAGIVSQVEDGFGYLASHSTSHGDRHAAIVLHRRPPALLVTTSHGPQYTQEFVTFYDHTLCQEIAMHAQEDIVEVVTKALEHAQMSIADVDFLVTHQPVAWAANAWREALGMPQEKFYESFEQYGNIACASVPVNLVESLEKHLIAAGDRVLIVSSGVGENHIALVEKVSPQLIRKTRF